VGQVGAMNVPGPKGGGKMANSMIDQYLDNNKQYAS
jgi:hypothetical protein